jgi:hypothetical protein
MSRPLPVEVLELIIGHVAGPLPKRNGQTNVPLYRNELARCMRVSTVSIYLALTPAYGDHQ